MPMLSESWVQSSVQHGGILGASEAARGIGMAEYVQGAPHPQSSSINFMHAAYMFYIPNFLVSCLKSKYFHIFSPFFSYLFITTDWMFSSWLLKHAVFDSMDLTFASFRPICVGKISV